MARLPTVGGDDGSWGSVLNTFLDVSHNADGTLQTSAVQNAILSSPNTFTATPQAVGTAFSSGQTQVYAGAITLAANGAAPPTVAPPFINFFAYCGGAAGNNGWQLGVDTHNHGGGQDLAISKQVNGAATDFFYINYTSMAIGIGAATPPSDNYHLDILSSSNDTMGCLTIGVGQGATGRPLDFFNSAGVDQLWLDTSFAFNSVAGGGGVFFAGEATNNVVMTLANNAKTLQYTFAVIPGSNIFEFKYNTGGQVIWWGGTDGSFRTFHNIGFYGNSAVAQPTAGGVSGGFTANGGTAMNSASTSTGNTGTHAYTFGDIVNALKTLGLIQS